jgi:hypothetical protein
VRRYRGHPGHFVCADRCLWHLHTEVQGFKVSSVGDFRPQLGKQADFVGKLEQLGAGYFYESHVYALDAVGRELTPGVPIETRAYQTASEAEAGHAELVDKYERAGG